MLPKSAERLGERASGFISKFLVSLCRPGLVGFLPQNPDALPMRYLFTHYPLNFPLANENILFLFLIDVNGDSSLLIEYFLLQEPSAGSFIKEETKSPMHSVAPHYQNQLVRSQPYTGMQQQNQGLSKCNNMELFQFVEHIVTLNLKPTLD